MADTSVNSRESDAVSVSTSSPSFSEIGEPEVFHKIIDKGNQLPGQGVAICQVVFNKRER